MTGRKASTRIIDFREADKSPEEDARQLDSRGHLKTAKQARARVRRTVLRGGKIDDETFETWAGKPIDDWDLQELAKGRPRDGNGQFRGRLPQSIPRAVHERITERFKQLVRDEMNFASTQAIAVVTKLLVSDEVDAKGKPIVPPSVQLQAAQWLVEHVIGKAVQPTTTDVSVKLQAILGAVMVNPTLDDNHPDMQALPRGYSAAHFGVRGEAVVDGEILGEYDDD